MTFDASGNVSGVFNFEPLDGSLDGPYGDIVHLTEGPDGALYYVDIGYSDIGGTFGVSKIRRIRFLSGNQAPIAVAAANPTAGPAPLAVNFSSAGSSDPEGQTLTYAWTFGDGGTSTAANPSHTYSQPGQYSARLSVSDGVNTTFSTPISISVGSPPTATILSPQDGSFFVAGDVISYSGDGTDPDVGTLPASAFAWTIDFLHEGHVHPGTPISGVKSGTFTIPTSGHDFSGNTRYRITLTVTDSTGLTDTRSVLVYPTQGEPLLQHGTGGPHRVSRRHRQDDTVRLRHADRLQPHGRGPQPGLGRNVVHVRVMVGRRGANAHDRRASLRSELRRHLPGERGATGDRRLRLQRGLGDDGCRCVGQWADGHVDERGDLGDGP